MDKGSRLYTGDMNVICSRAVSQSICLKSTVQSLCNLGKLQDATNLILSNQVQFDHSLYSNILQLCIEKKAENHGRLIHKHLSTAEFDSYLTLGTKLIIFYSKIGDMKNGREVFDKMPERTVVSWTALLSGYSQNGDCEEAIKVFLRLHRAGVKANQFTYGSALRACTSLVCLREGQQIQGCVQKGRFAYDLFVQSALVDFHSKCGEMKDACRVFEAMSRRDLVCWNAMIGGFAVQGFSNDAFLMFHSMLNEGMTADNFTLGSLLKASVGDSFLSNVRQIHGFIVKLGYGFYNILSASLIDAYVKCGNVKSADHVYKSMLKKDIVSCTALITGYAREGVNFKDALDLFKGLYQMSIKIDYVILCSMLNICANATLLDFGMLVHGVAVKYQPYHDIAMGNALIDMYSKCGEIKYARQIFDEMKVKNIISWTSLISGYGKHGYGHDAIALYKKMEHEGLKPNSITFLSLLFSCSHNGLAAEGWEYFNTMVSKYDIIPRAEHYACMVDLFARGGQIDEAYHLISKMNMKPNASVWGSILGACSVYGNMPLGEIAASNLFNIDPENSINYDVLANIYASADLWDSAWRTRKLMKGRDIRKSSGCSSLQLKNMRPALPPGC